MDWAAFFKENSQSWFTLVGVFLGSSITFLINHLNLRNQSRERDKDRKEAREAARIHLATELMLSDIKTIDDSLDNVLRVLNEIAKIKWKGTLNNLTADRIALEIASEYTKDDGQLSRWLDSNKVAHKLAYALGDEFSSEYNRFDELCNEYANSLLLTPDADEKEWTSNIIYSAGKLHSMLVEKLLSIRVA